VPLTSAFYLTEKIVSDMERDLGQIPQSQAAINLVNNVKNRASRRRSIQHQAALEKETPRTSLSSRNTSRFDQSQQQEVNVGGPIVPVLLMYDDCTFEPAFNESLSLQKRQKLKELTRIAERNQVARKMHDIVKFKR